MTTPDYKAAHKASIWHREQVQTSTICGCFHCLQTFPPTAIVEWIDDRGVEGTTALCPRCGIDAVLGDASGFPITPTFLRAMQRRWFGSDHRP